MRFLSHFTRQALLRNPARCATPSHHPSTQTNPPHSSRLRSPFHHAAPSFAASSLRWHDLGANLSKREPNLHLDSLRQTLEAHREANRASVIHKVGQDGKRQKLRLAVVTASIKPSSRGKATRHVKVAQGGRNQRHWDEKFSRSDYKGICPGLAIPWQPSPSLPAHQRYPWTMKIPTEEKPTVFDAATDRLTEEIISFESYISPTPVERLAANNAFRELKSCLQAADGSMVVDVVGSRATGLAMPMSDIDINVSAEKPIQFQSERRTAFAHLVKLGALLAGLPHGPKATAPRRFWVNDVVSARVPILAGRHLPTNLSFQVQSTLDATGSMEYTKAYVAEFPTLRPLFMVLKQTLDMRLLYGGDNRRGGVTSYPLIIMIVAALKFCEGKIPRRDAGRQLLFFLDMYSDIDFYTTGIALSPLQYMVKRLPLNSRVPSPKAAALAPDRDASSPPLEDLQKDDVEARRRSGVLVPSKPFLMCLQDPANPANDLGRAIHLIKDVQATFIEARKHLRTAMGDWENQLEERGKTKEGPSSSVLGWCLGGDYSIFEQERSDLAKSVPELNEKMRLAVDSWDSQTLKNETRTIKFS